MRDPVGTFWESAFTLVNLVQWLWLVHENRASRLSPEQQELKSRFFNKLSNHELKILLKIAEWKQVEPGEMLIQQGRPVPNLLLLTEGTAKIIVDGNIVSSTVAGDYLGEIAYLTNKNASATVEIAESARYLSFNNEKLLKASEKSESLKDAVNSLIDEKLGQKLIRQNKMISRMSTNVAGNFAC